MYGIRDGKLQLIEDSSEEVTESDINKRKIFLQKCYLLSFSSDDDGETLTLSMKEMDSIVIDFLVYQNDELLWKDQEPLNSDGKWSSTGWKGNDTTIKYEIHLNNILVESGIKDSNVKIFDISYHDFKESDILSENSSKLDYVHYDSQSKDWELVVNEIEGKEIFSWPLVTQEFCNDIIRDAENYGQWTSGRHENYSTHDILLDSFQYNQLYNSILEEYAHPVVKWIWKCSGIQWDNIVSENFIVKYDTVSDGWQNNLGVHHDASDYTFVLTLNNEFEGGGTWFPRQKVLLKNEVGHVALHPTITHRHGARSVTEGIRYVLISFCSLGKK